MNAVTVRLQARKWKRLGIAGFDFFLVKGLLWLFAPIAFYLLG